MTLIRSLGHGSQDVQVSCATARFAFMNQDLTHRSIDGSDMSSNVKGLSSNSSSFSIEMRYLSFLSTVSRAAMR